MQRFIITCLAIFGLAAMLQADAWNKKTILTVNESIEVPGAILKPGKYVVKLADSQSNRHIVQFMNETEDEVISTVLAIPNQRMEPPDDSEFLFFEETGGRAPALRAWFYPGDTFGQEFAYPEARATELARLSGEEVPSVSEKDMKSTEAVAQPSNEREKDTTSAAARPTPPPAPAAQAPTRTQPPAPRTEPTPDPNILAQAQREQPREPRPTPASETRVDELPATSSSSPLLGLIGLLSIAGAVSLLRVADKRTR